MDNSTPLSQESTTDDGETSVVQNELCELKRMISEVSKAITGLRSKAYKDGNLLQELTSDFPLVKADAARGDQLYDTKELAGRWQVSERTVETEVAEGNLVPTFIRGARRFTPDAVRAYERTNSGLRRRRGARRRAAAKTSS